MLYGIRVLRKGSERLFGARLQRMLHRATEGRWRGMFVGLGLALLIPSSTGVAFLSVEAMSAGYLALTQMLAVMLGANIGFTVTAQFLALKFYDYNAVFLAIGVPLFIFGRRRLPRGLGQMLMGLGFLFLSIQILSAAVAPLRTSADVMDLMALLEKHPLLMVLLAVIIKTVIQSATATIGLAIALSYQGILSPPAMLAVVIGANIGIGTTAMIAGFARVETRRMALGVLCYKLLGAAIVLPFLEPLVDLLTPISPQGSGQLAANAHTCFNIGLALIGIPLVALMARFLGRVVADRAEPAENEPRYLNPAYLESPALALGQASQELVRMADILRTMLRDAKRAFTAVDDDLVEAVQKRDDVVDDLNNAIKQYVVKLSEQEFTAETSRREAALLAFSNELENVGDIIDKNLMELAKKKNTLQVEFSEPGRAELERYFDRVIENFEIAMATFTNQDRALAQKLLDHKHAINESERELRTKHFQRLQAGLKESIETSAIHLDILTNLRSINSHLTAVAYPILEW